VQTEDEYYEERLAVEVECCISLHEPPQRYMWRFTNVCSCIFLCTQCISFQKQAPVTASDIGD